MSQILLVPQQRWVGYQFTKYITILIFILHFSYCNLYAENINGKINMYNDGVQTYYALDTNDGKSIFLCFVWESDKNKENMIVSKYNENGKTIILHGDIIPDEYYKLKFKNNKFTIVDNIEIADKSKIKIDCKQFVFVGNSKRWVDGTFQKDYFYPENMILQRVIINDKFDVPLLNNENQHVLLNSRINRTPYFSKSKKVNIFSVHNLYKDYNKIVIIDKDGDMCVLEYKEPYYLIINLYRKYRLDNNNLIYNTFI